MNVYESGGEYKKNLEIQIIGSIMIWPKKVMSEVMGEVNASDFDVKACAAVYNYAVEKFTKGEAIDPVLATESLAGIVEKPDQFLANCMTSVGGTSVNGGLYARMLHEAAENIRLYTGVSDAMNNCDAKDLPAELIKIAQEAMRGKLGKRRTLNELLNQYYDSLNDGPPERTNTGFQKLDSYMMGMRAGNLVILAARPGVGKSAFAMQIAENVAKTGKKVLVYSMEMKGEELTERLLANHSGVPLDTVVQRNFDPEDKQTVSAINKAANELYSLPIIINDEANVAPSKVRTEAIEIGDVGLIVVDYVGLMESDGGKRLKENRNLELGSISRDLKKIAVELDIPILMLCQLNREVGEGEKPEIRNLRDSGELEQNANKIMFLWRISEEQQTVGVYVAKNRQGKTGVVQMIFDGEHMRFLERYEDIPMENKKRRGNNFYD